MKHPLPWRTLLAAALALITLNLVPGSAQQPPRYAEFAYDSAFHIGGHGWIPYQAALDLRLDFMFTYVGGINQWPVYLAASAWPIPGYHSDTIPAVPEDSLMWDYVRNGSDSLRMVYNLPNWHWLIYSATGFNVGSARSLLSYPGHNLERAPAFTFAWRSDSAELKWLDSFKLYKKLTVARDSTGLRSDLRMVASPTYVSSQALNRIPAAMYDSAHVPRSDTADWVRASFDLAFPGIDELQLYASDTLAWARFYWRVDTVLTGNTCYCGIYEPIRDSVLGSTFVITKGMYDNATDTTFGMTHFREFGRWINLRGGKVPVPGDSVHHT